MLRRARECLRLDALLLLQPDEIVNLRLDPVVDDRRLSALIELGNLGGRVLLVIDVIPVALGIAARLIRRLFRLLEHSAQIADLKLSVSVHYATFQLCSESLSSLRPYRSRLGFSCGRDEIDHGRDMQA